MPRVKNECSDDIELTEESPKSRGGCAIAGIAEINGEFSRRVINSVQQAGIQMEHRGGRIGERGDGAGILLRPDRNFFLPAVQRGLHLSDNEQLMVGTAWFLPDVRGDTLRLQSDIESGIVRSGFRLLGWRRVPMELAALSAEVRDKTPDFWQILMARGLVPQDEVARNMYLLRNTLGSEFRAIYFPSLTPDTTVYKVLGTTEQLFSVFPDLRDPAFTTSAVLLHRRYSTNTVPRPLLAQPFGMLAHNGEINTNRANVNAVHDFERALRLFFKVLMRQGSDSANLDRMVELFSSGSDLSLSEALRRFLIPAWRDLRNLDPQVQAYYEGSRRALGNLAVLEGPAAVVALDGNEFVASLDRMGLRPLRFIQTQDGLFAVTSEIGAVPVEPSNILQTGQLDAGQMLSVDRRTGEILIGPALEQRIATGSPLNFAELQASRVFVPSSSTRRYEFDGSLDSRLSYFGWDRDRKMAVVRMIREGKEQILSMGHTKPLAVLSRNAPSLFKYFRQIIAVVTNPPIDPIREGGSFDLTTYLGRKPVIHEVRHDYTVHPQYKLESPFLTDDELANITRESSREGHPKVATVDISFPEGSHNNLAAALVDICQRVVRMARKKEAQIIVLSDRHSNHERLPIPSLLAVGAVNNALKNAGLRRNVSLVADIGEVQEGHDAAVLFAHGVDAVNPYMMWHIAYSLEKSEGDDPIAALRKVLDLSLRRVMSKMGITTLDGYRDSQLMEAVGIDRSVTEFYLGGTASHIGGIGIEQIYEDICRRIDSDGGLQRNDEPNAYRREVYEALQQVARGEDPQAYEKFLAVVYGTSPIYLRDLLKFKEDQASVAVFAVVPSQEIIERVFRGAAMSHGALNGLAHRAIAAAFNSLNSFSNCGEGGELATRNCDGEDNESRSRIRQVASARFGVDASYLVNADEIQIKIGQGAKPGEGGHLPAQKVTVEIAAIRKVQQGVDLISPPPHHSIYSIEDLAQLVYNLKQVNPKAKISVKVPAVTDLGTIALGIVKAGADVIEISCSSGGTGAASVSSIEHAGLPLERSLAEVHQILTENGVRGWVKLRADGGVKTGMDVAKLMALGADETTFGSALMVAEMCTMCRGCAKGKCPAGIATQDERMVLRAMTRDGETIEDVSERYEEAKRGIQNYLKAVAEEFRQILAKLGLHDPSELVGRVDLLMQASSENPKHKVVDLSKLLRNVSVFADSRGTDAMSDVVRQQTLLVLDNDANATTAREVGNGVFEIPLHVRNTDRAIGAALAGKIARGEIQIPEGSEILLKLDGYAGQGLGFAAVTGMKIVLTGYANDSVGEAMSGGAKIIVRQPKEVDGERSKNSVIGNAACYGATGGVLYCEGKTGQRLGVRNSGAIIVVEGTGKYPFEYMTSGIGVVLEDIGNVACAGMTDGIVFCRDDAVEQKVHSDSVVVVPSSESDLLALEKIIRDYYAETDSRLAFHLLENWENERRRFKKIAPRR